MWIIVFREGLDAGKNSHPRGVTMKKNAWKSFENRKNYEMEASCI